MATDATGTPTSPDNIPKYNPSVDAPSGLGFNAAMDAIQTAITSVRSGGILKSIADAAGDLLVASGADAWTRLAPGTNGHVLTMVSGAPAWQAASSAATWQELGYTEFTSDVSVTSTTEGTPDDVVSAGALTFSGQPIVIEFFTPQAQQVNNAELRFSLWEGATNRGKIGAQGAIGNAGGHGPILVRRRIAAPSAGSLTFKVSAWNSAAGTGTVKAGSGGSGAFLPGYIRILQKAA